jgi:hypothetical protein
MSNTPNLRPMREALQWISSLRNREGMGGINDCSTPDLGASKADLEEFHREKMRSLRAHRRAGRDTITVRGPWYRASKNNEPQYRKSIWPAAKIKRSLPAPPS